MLVDDDDVLAVFRHAFDCARSGDASWLQSFFEAGGSVDLTNDKGDTLLILAAYHVQPGAVSTLLTLGAAVDRVNDNGQTALAAAVFRRSTSIVRMLVEAGADPAAGGSIGTRNCPVLRVGRHGSDADRAPAGVALLLGPGLGCPLTSRLVGD